jgi:hypothetical protein
MKWETAKEMAFRLRTKPCNIYYWGRTRQIRSRGTHWHKEFSAEKAPMPNKSRLKLTMSDRRLIRTKYSKIARSAIIAIIFGVSRDLIRDIIANRKIPKALQ